MNYIGINKIFSSIICLVAFTLEIPADEVKKNIVLKSSTVIVSLDETQYYVQSLQESEGEFVAKIFSFKDGAYVIFFQGCLNEFDVDRLLPVERYYEVSKISSWGYYEDGKVWRIDKYPKNVKIYYCRVSLDKKTSYDRILNSVVLLE